MILEPIILSVKIAFISTIFTFLFGILLARVITKYNF